MGDSTSSLGSESSLIKWAQSSCLSLRLSTRIPDGEEGLGLPMFHFYYAVLTIGEEEDTCTLGLT